MAVTLTIIYMILMILLIWWIQGQAKKWDDAHGGSDHGQEQHHD